MSMRSLLFAPLALSVGACNLGPQEVTTSSAVAGPVAHEARTFLVPGHSALGASNPKARPGFQPRPQQPQAQDDASEAGKLLWAKPDAWKEAENKSGMRMATYVVPHAKGDTEDGDVSVSRVGGDIDANIERWVGQFSEKPTPDRKDIAADSFKLVLVRLSGTFIAGGMGGKTEPKPDTTLLAAIVDTGVGDPYFFKLTGPKATVSAAKEDFDKLVSSFRVTTN